MKKSHGGNSTRSRRLKAKPRLSAAKHLREFKEGDRVRINANPSYQHGRPNTLRFNGRIARVVRKQGNAYILELNDLNKKKTLILANVHLEKL
jgi:large subunit ribosomal protein L21e